MRYYLTSIIFTNRIMKRAPKPSPKPLFGDQCSDFLKSLPWVDGKDEDANLWQGVAQFIRKY